MKQFYFQFVFFLKKLLIQLSFFLLLFFTCSISYSTEIFYIEKNSMVIGDIRKVRVAESETVADMTNRYESGFQDLLIANQNSHHWAPTANSEYIIPSMYVLPEKDYNGIILNLAELRLYFYIPGTDLYENTKVITLPVGIGRLDWKTPLGETFIKSKVKNPTWYPPKSIILEHEERGEVLPRQVESGPDNPLGYYALKLNVDGGYLLHGTNKKHGIGMMVSHGCVRLRNKDIETVFYNSFIGTKVKIINAPIKLGEHNGYLYMEVHAFNNEEVYSNNVQNLLTTENIYKPVVAVMNFLENNPNFLVNWKDVFKTYEESSGIPVIVGKRR